MLDVSLPEDQIDNISNAIITFYGGLDDYNPHDIIRVRMYVSNSAP
mgnify:CR=1 FL=1